MNNRVLRMTGAKCISNIVCILSSAHSTKICEEGEQGACLEISTAPQFSMVSTAPHPLSTSHF